MIDFVYNQMHFANKPHKEIMPDEPLVHELYLKGMEDREALRRLKSQKNNFIPNDTVQKIDNNPKKLEPQLPTKQIENYKFHREGIDFKLWTLFRVSFTVFFWTSFCLLISLFIFDVRNKINSEIEQKRLEIEICHIEYRDNNCEVPLPALKTFCLEREKCMVTDVHASVMKIKHIVLVLTEIINSAIGSSDLKTLAFAALITFGYLFFEIFSRRKAKTD